MEVTNGQTAYFVYHDDISILGTVAIVFRKQHNENKTDTLKYRHMLSHFTYTINKCDVEFCILLNNDYIHMKQMTYNWIAYLE